MPIVSDNVPSRSCNGRISALVEMELRAGNRSRLSPFPKRVRPIATRLPSAFHSMYSSVQSMPFCRLALGPILGPQRVCQAWRIEGGLSSFALATNRVASGSLRNTLVTSTSLDRGGDRMFDGLACKPRRAKSFSLCDPRRRLLVDYGADRFCGRINICVISRRRRLEQLWLGHLLHILSPGGLVAWHLQRAHGPATTTGAALPFRSVRELVWTQGAPVVTIPSVPVRRERHDSGSKYLSPLGGRE